MPKFRRCPALRANRMHAKPSPTCNWKSKGFIGVSCMTSLLKRILISDEYVSNSNLCGSDTF